MIKKERNNSNKWGEMVQEFLSSIDVVSTQMPAAYCAQTIRQTPPVPSPIYTFRLLIQKSPSAFFFLSLQKWLRLKRLNKLLAI